MPLFEFRCHNNHVFEKLIMNTKNDIIIVCPECGSEKCEKIISKSTFKINGFSDKNGYSRSKCQTDKEIIERGPEESLQQMKHNFS